jgi:phytoene dehydrogenase-like protein
MQSEIHRCDVVVIGGGLAGLTAGAYLARAGRSVRILERASETGGRAATRCEGGFFLNRGAHALYRGGDAEVVLAELGVAYSGRSAPTNGKALRAGALYQLPTGALSLFTTGLLSLRAKAVAARWLERTPKMSPESVENTSVDEWLEGCPSEVRAVMETFVRVATFVNDPSRFSAATALVQLQRALAGVLYLDGGWQTLIDGVAERVTKWGAAVTTQARVASLEPDGDRYRVTHGDGSVTSARAVVLAVPPDEAARLVAGAGANIPRGFASPTQVKAAALDLALARLPRPEDRFVLGVDRPLYLSVHSGVAKLAPEGKAVVHLLKYLAPGENDPARDREELESLMDLVQPGWRSELVFAQYLPRMTVVERLDLASEGGSRGRPATDVPGLPGVTVAGDWVQGGAWLVDATLASARAAAQSILSRLSPARAVA